MITQSYLEELSRSEAECWSRSKYFTRNDPWRQLYHSAGAVVKGNIPGGVLVRGDNNNIEKLENKCS